MTRRSGGRGGVLRSGSVSGSVLRDSRVGGWLKKKEEHESDRLKSHSRNKKESGHKAKERNHASLTLGVPSGWTAFI